MATAQPATISVGDKLPAATLSYYDAAGDLKTVSISDLTSGKKVVLLAVPGAFTPTCSQKHLPGFVEHAAEFKAKGIDTVACLCPSAPALLSKSTVVISPTTSINTGLWLQFSTTHNQTPHL
ncbi:Peroxiredoxin-2E- chloroplastic [Striga hermonthica]|uniref:glutaredoxin-dependent peroxiredoxin n=1 Tax=Striga hermonthica TaxID=68872 RepID=A0A9N7NFR6_STRHE|nr:Peroxiredoxin-2E- chloroplastic [Striga hermonthica]